MRCFLNQKNVARLARQTGLPLRSVLVRGGTDHRRDLVLTTGTVMHLYKDGRIEVSDWLRGREVKQLLPPKEAR